MSSELPSGEASSSPTTLAEGTEIEVEPIADIHVHFREGDVMRSLVEGSILGGADVAGPQPNTNEGLTTAQKVISYIERAKSFVSAGQKFSFVPFLMGTEYTTKDDIDDCVQSGIRDQKFYPYLRTTKSEKGIRRYGWLLSNVEHCGERGVRCHFHPEHPWMTFGNRDAEFAFLPIAKIFLEETETIIFWEHGTDARCIPFWKDMAKTYPGRFYVTLCAHHLFTNEDLVYGDVRAVCKPPIKTENDRLGLVGLVAEDYPWVIAISDSAFHPLEAKQVDEGRCACGALTGHFLLPLHAHALERLLVTPAGIQTFINFTSRNARQALGLPPASSSRTLIYRPQKIPLRYNIGHQIGLPFAAGQTINWQLPI